MVVESKDIFKSFDDKNMVNKSFKSLEMTAFENKNLVNKNSTFVDLFGLYFTGFNFFCNKTLRDLKADLVNTIVMLTKRYQ